MNTTTTKSIVESMQAHIAGDGQIGPGTPLHFTPAAQCGDTICQGDVEITRIDSVPPNYHRRTTTNTNIVHGEAGSETHRIDDPSLVIFHDRQNWSIDDLDGPVLEVVETTGITHTGPGRHGHVSLCPGIYQIGYPRVWETEQARERRAKD